ncbi:uncharacterized protein Polr1F [Hetaerina americana]|uniref:uncharacterized protein Polr1F n=1 Tax=Hetaerina americana TaxID=62018 RepID=UPI003A7F2905
MQDTVDIRFSKSELNSLAKTKGTCVTLEKKTRVVFLLPSQLSDIKSGIRENLDSNLLKYDYETKAIMIGYEKIKILSKYGSICYGYSKIALRIEANLYLFKPAVGRVLEGVVCKQSGRHLGCLVHKGFNVSIPLEDDNGYACGWDFTIGQGVKFTVIKLDLTSGPLPYILGQLYVDGVDCGVESRARDWEQMGSKIRAEGGGNGVVDSRAEDEDGHGGTVPSPSQQQASGREEVAWNTGAPPEQQQGEEEGDGRNSLISQLLRTVERSITETPKKVKPKRAASLDPQSLGSKGPKTLPGIVLLPPPLAEQLPGTPSRGKGGGGQQRRGKKGGGGSEEGDTGSIIDRLLALSRREVLGVVESRKGRKRRAEDGCAEEGSGRKLPRKSAEEQHGATAQVGKHGGELHGGKHPQTVEPNGGVQWGGTAAPGEKSESPKTHEPSRLKVGEGEAHGRTCTVVNHLLLYFISNFPSSVNVAVGIMLQMAVTGVPPLNLSAVNLHEAKASVGLEETQEELCFHKQCGGCQ